MFPVVCFFFKIQCTNLRGSKKIFLVLCVFCQPATNAAMKSILLFDFSILCEPKLTHSFCSEELIVREFNSEKYLNHLYLNRHLNTSLDGILIRMLS